MLDCYVVGRSSQEMNVLRHDYKGVDLISPLTAILIQGFEEQTHIVLDDEESAALPRRECYEIGSGRGDESSRLQEQTSAAKAAVFA